MPDNKPAAPDISSVNKSLLTAAAGLRTAADDTKERFANMSPEERKAESIRNKREREKVVRKVAQEIYGDRKARPPKNAREGNKLATKAIKNFEAKIEAIKARGRKDYTGKKKLTAQQVRTQVRSEARKFKASLNAESSTNFAKSTGNIGGKQTVGQQAFGSGKALNRVTDAVNRVAGQSYSGGNQRKGVYATDKATGRRTYVKPKAGAGKAGKSKFSASFPKRPVGRPKGTKGFDKQ